MKNTEVTLLSDATATLIPDGLETTLPKGTTALITQALGGTVTLRTDRGLYRLNGAEIDALGADIADKLKLHGAAKAANTGDGLSESAVWEALKECFDPEIPVNIVDLGLIYDLRLAPSTEGKQSVVVKMTLTAQGCGMGPAIAADARAKIEALPDVDSADVQIVWDPVWNPSMISPDGRKALGLE